MTDLPVPDTTRTIEVSQLEELNLRLEKARKAPRITAADLGLAGAHLFAGGLDQLPGSAVLGRLGWDGPPEFPYVHGHFREADRSPAELVVEFHTKALQELSRRLKVRQSWG